MESQTQRPATAKPYLVLLQISLSNQMPAGWVGEPIFFLKVNSIGLLICIDKP